MDLSNAHPIQRAILILLRYLVGLGVVMALISQYHWLDIRQQTPIGKIGFLTDTDGLFVVLIGFRRGMQFRTTAQWGTYSESDARIIHRNIGTFVVQTEPRKRYGIENGYQQVFSGPGLELWNSGPLLPSGITMVFVNHSWIIFATILSYFTARRLLLRSTKVKTQGPS